MTVPVLQSDSTVETFAPLRAHGAGRRPTSVSIQEVVKSFPVRRSVRAILAHPLTRPRTTIIQGLNLDIDEGEMFGILGLNGAGKTTLLKMLATLILPDAGTATVGGCDIIEEAGRVRAMLAMVTADERSLNWRLSARENVRLFAGLHRMDREESLKRTDEVLASVNLDGEGDKMVGAFSSGMRQRLLLARALLSRPRILLLDEPTRSLDPVTAHEFRRLLRDEIVGQRGVTVILATHNPEEAFAYCDRVAVLHRGVVAALGSARALVMRFGQERYRIWTPTAEHPCFDALVRGGYVTDLVRQADVEGARLVECTIAGGDSEAADVLRRLVEARVSVSRFERVDFPLSSLIARIVETQDGSPRPGLNNA
jgi:ABC-type multidrug transport system ATPase subunit